MFRSHCPEVLMGQTPTPSIYAGEWIARAHFNTVESIDVEMVIRLELSYCCANHVHRRFQYPILIEVDNDQLDFLVHQLFIWLCVCVYAIQSSVVIFGALSIIIYHFARTNNCTTSVITSRNEIQVKFKCQNNAKDNRWFICETHQIGCNIIRSEFVV